MRISGNCGIEETHSCSTTLQLEYNMYENARLSISFGMMPLLQQSHIEESHAFLLDYIAIRVKHARECATFCCVWDEWHRAIKYAPACYLEVNSINYIEMIENIVENFYTHRINQNFELSDVDIARFHAWSSLLLDVVCGNCCCRYCIIYCISKEHQIPRNGFVFMYALNLKRVIYFLGYIC